LKMESVCLIVHFVISKFQNGSQQCMKDETTDEQKAQFPVIVQTRILW